jgi:DNA-binding response OmpR family regulator
MREDKFSVLCVDDDPDILESLKAVLEANGYIYRAALSAQEGLRAFEAEKPDAVIADLMMEEVDAGARFVRELRTRGCTAPIFLLSAVGDALEGQVDSAALGLSGVFQKPIQIGELLSVLGAALARA